MAHNKLQKMVKKVEIKSDGDVFHEIFKCRPHHISTMSSDCVQNVELCDGEWGKVGCVFFVNYTHDGEKKVGKNIVEAIDEEKKTVTYKIIEGDLMDLYKSFIYTLHVDTQGENNLVTWTFEYEKMKDDVEDPTTLMDFFIAMSKDIENHHLNME